jgi:hypothetical protein
MTSRWPLAFTAVLVLSAVGRAQQPAARDTSPATDPHAVQPERPTVATHAGTVAPGWLEIETGVERDQFVPSQVGLQTPTVLKFGIADHMQFSVFGNVVKPAGGSAGFGDLAAGAKWRLVDDAPIVGDFAVLPSIKFPTGSADAGTGTGTTDAGLLLISSHQFGDISMDVNVGYTHRSGNGSAAPTSATLWTVSVGGPAVGSLGWTAECYGYPGTGGPSGQPPIVALLGGPTFLARSYLAFDAGIIVPVRGGQPHALYAGGVYNVGHLWGKSGSSR